MKTSEIVNHMIIKYELIVLSFKRKTKQNFIVIS